MTKKQSKKNYLPIIYDLITFLCKELNINVGQDDANCSDAQFLYDNTHVFWHIENNVLYLYLSRSDLGNENLALLYPLYLNSENKPVSFQLETYTCILCQKNKDTPIKARFLSNSYNI